jgi:hypothetical protein
MLKRVKMGFLVLAGLAALAFGGATIAGAQGSKSPTPTASPSTEAPGTETADDQGTAADPADKSEANDPADKADANEPADANDPADKAGENDAADKADGNEAGEKNDADGPGGHQDEAPSTSSSATPPGT